MIFTDLDLVDTVFRNSLKIFELSGALQTRWERLFQDLTNAEANIADCLCAEAFF